MAQTVIEKVWHKSKKFLAFLIMELILGSLAFYVFFRFQTVEWPMSALLMTIIMNMGFIAVAFNAKQAELDKYVRFAALTGRVSNLPVEKTDESV